jgi:hypothetical protein
MFASLRKFSEAVMKPGVRRLVTQSPQNIIIGLSKVLRFTNGARWRLSGESEVTGYLTVEAFLTWLC